MTLSEGQGEGGSGIAKEGAGVMGESQGDGGCDSAPGNGGRLLLGYSLGSGKLDECKTLKH